MKFASLAVGGVGGTSIGIPRGMVIRREVTISNKECMLSLVHLP